MIHPQPVVVAVVDAFFSTENNVIGLLNEMHGANLYEDRC